MQQKFMNEMTSVCLKWYSSENLSSQFTSLVSDCNIWWCGWTMSDTPFAFHTEVQSTPRLRSRIGKIFFVNKVSQSRYRPGVTWTVPESLGSQISWQRHRMVVRLSALTTGRFYPQEIILVLISVRGWVETKAIVRPEGVCQWKIPMIQLGIEPAISRFVPPIYIYIYACI